MASCSLPSGVDGRETRSRKRDAEEETERVRISLSFLLVSAGFSKGPVARVDFSPAAVAAKPTEIGRSTRLKVGDRLARRSFIDDMLSSIAERRVERPKFIKAI